MQMRRALSEALSNAVPELHLPAEREVREDDDGRDGEEDDLAGADDVFLFDLFAGEAGGWGGGDDGAGEGVEEAEEAVGFVAAVAGGEGVRDEVVLCVADGAVEGLGIGGGHV